MTYPALIEKERLQTINGVQGNKYNVSGQMEKELQGLRSAEKLKLANTEWRKEIVKNEFKQGIYHTLFINNGQNYLSYWLSSRSVGVYEYGANYNLSKIQNGFIDYETLCTYDKWYSSSYTKYYKIRPIVTINSNVQVDTNDSSKTGQSAQNAWVLK